MWSGQYGDAAKDTVCCLGPLPLLPQRPRQDVIALFILSCKSKPKVRCREREGRKANSLAVMALSRAPQM